MEGCVKLRLVRLIGDHTWVKAESRGGSGHYLAWLFNFAIDPVECLEGLECDQPSNDSASFNCTECREVAQAEEENRPRLEKFLKRLADERELIQVAA